MILLILSFLDINSIMNFGYVNMWAVCIVNRFPAYTNVDCSKQYIIDYKLYSRLSYHHNCVKRFLLKGNSWVFIPNNLYVSVSSILMMFKNLTVLDLSHCHKITSLLVIPSFTKFIPALKQLEQLDLSGNWQIAPKDLMKSIKVKVVKCYEDSRLTIFSFRGNSE